MRRTIQNGLSALLLACLLLMQFSQVEAARGVPGSAQFGYGAELHLDGPFIEQSLEMAGDLELDWIKVRLSWAAVQPDPAKPAQTKTLDPVMLYAAQHEIAVMISLTDAPLWAVTGQGPEPSQTAALVAQLAQTYPKTLQAIELFPGANTLGGWGARPDPQAYMNLFRASAESLRSTAPEVIPVAAGLRIPDLAKGDMSDRAYLQALYQMGAAELMPVISLQFENVTGAPATFPDSKNERALRRYENLRQVMSENGHQSGQIWITHLGSLSGKIEVSDSAYVDVNMQSNWMALAYLQLRTQLYVGVVFGQSINPEPGGSGAGGFSLIGQSGETHPFYSVLHEMISLNNTGSVSLSPGRSKEGNLAKMRP